jgi:hypothetical protein
VTSYPVTGLFLTELTDLTGSEKNPPSTNLADKSKNRFQLRGGGSILRALKPLSPLKLNHYSSLHLVFAVTAADSTYQAANTSAITLRIYLLTSGLAN